MSLYEHKKNKPSTASIIRAIASSTAIETGQTVKAIEAKLKKSSTKFKHIALAN